MTLHPASLVLTGLGTPAAAQCFGPDNLTQPCCTTTNANLPAFPPISLPGTGICYDSCAASASDCVTIDFSPPGQVTCGQYTAQVTVSDCGSGTPYMFGLATLDYTRTWEESSVSPPLPATGIQVWRFVAKLDLSLGPVLPPACVAPTCALAHPTAFYYGYVDYALDCSSGTWETAVALFHNCDFFVHTQGISDRPGTFHPTRSYGLVAPHTSANPFVPSILPSPGGPLFAEAMRTVGSSIGIAACIAEDPLSQGFLSPILSACICPLSLTSPQVTLSRITGDGSCPDATGLPGSFTSVNFFGPVPWFEMMSFSLGSWTTGASYPGPERVWMNEGLFNYRDACLAAGGTTFGTYVEIEYGATTKGGWSVLPTAAGTPAPDGLVDLASNFSHLIGSGPIVPPVLGSIRPTDHLIYVNVF